MNKLSFSQNLKTLFSGMITVLTLRGIAIGLVLFSSVLVHAQAGPAALNISGGLFYPSGQPILQNNVNFKLEILDKNNTCVLYSETHTGEDLSDSKGGFSLLLGRGTSNVVNYIDGSLPAMTAKVFLNPGTPQTFTGCGGVTLSSGDERLVRVSYDLGSGYVAMSPNVPVVSSAYAMVAETLGGKRAADFLQVQGTSVGSLNQTNTEYAFSLTNWPKLKDLIDGLSNQYLRSAPTSPVDFNGQRLSNIAAPGTSTDAATKGYADSFIAGKSVDASGVGPSIGTGNAIIWDGSKWVTGVAAGIDSSKLPLAGGTMSGAITMGGFDLFAVGNVNLSAQKKLRLGNFDDTQEGAMLPSLTGTDKGVSWYNTTSNVYKIWDGSHAIVQTYLDGITNKLLPAWIPATTVVAGTYGSSGLTVPRFTVGADGRLTAAGETVISGVSPGGTAGGDLVGSYPNPTIGTSAITTVKVNDGAITTAKLSATSTAMGGRVLLTDSIDPTQIVYFNCLPNEIMKWTASGWSCATVASLSPVTSVAGKSGAVTLVAGDVGGLGMAALLDYGTAAGQLVQLDGGGKILPQLLPATTGTITGVTAGAYLTGGGTVGVVTLNIDVGSTSNKVVALNGSAQLPAVDGSLLTGVNAVSLQGRSIASTAPGLNQVLGFNSTSSMWEPVSATAGSVTNVGSGVGLLGGPITSVGTLAVDVGSAAGKIVQENASAQIAQLGGSEALPAYTFVGNNSGLYGTGSTLGLATTGTARLSIDSLGNVGIGTTSPSSKLQVAGSLSAGNITAVSSTGTVYSAVKGAAAGANSYGVFQFQNYTDSKSWSIDNRNGTTTPAEANSLVFRYFDGASTYSTSLSLSANGNVGVGTSLPAALLDVYGTGAYSALLVPRDIASQRPTGINGMIRYNTTSNMLEGFINGAWSNIASGGGVGTVQSVATSTGLLGGPITSNGTLSVDVGSSALKIVQENANAQIAQLNGTALLPSYSFANDKTSGLYLPGPGSISLATNGTSQFVIDGSGQIGVGTSSPQNTIDVHSSNSAGIYLSTDTTSNLGASYLNMSTKNGLYRGAIGVAPNVPGVGPIATLGGALPNSLILDSTGTSGFGSVQIATAGAIRATVTNVGRLGIGTTTPASILDVYATGSDSALLLPRAATTARPTGVNGMMRYNSSTNAFEFFQNNTWVNYLSSGSSSSGYVNGGNSYGANATLGLNDYNNLDLVTAGSSRMTLLANGNVGIGSTSPGFALDVNGDINMLAGSTGLRAGGTSILRLNGGQTQLRSSGTVGVFVNNSGTAAMSFDSTGQVGIGVTSPNSALDIAGNLRFTGTSATNAYIDRSVNDGGTFLWGGIATNAQSRLAVYGSGHASLPNYAIVNSNVFQVRDISNTVKMTVDGNNNVGIGTTTIRGALDIYATGAYSAMIVPRDSTAQRPSSSINGMMRYNSSTNAFEFFQNNSWVNYLASGSASAGYVNGGNAYGAAATLGLTDSNRLDLVTGGTARITMLPTGYVGIGTTNPTLPLDVNGIIRTNSYVNAFYYNAISNGNYSPLVSYNGTGATNEKYWDLFHNASTFQLRILNDAYNTAVNAIVFSRSGMSVTQTVIPTGNLGIGTATPMAALDVVGQNTAFPASTGTTTTGLAMRLESNSNAVLDFGNAGAGGTWLQATNKTALGTTYPLLLNPNGGRVSIGTTGTPGAALDVYGVGTSGSGMIVPRDTTANRPIGTNGMMRYNSQTNAFEFFQNNAWVNYLASGSSSSGYVNGGNSYGANATLGLNDSYRLDLMTAGSARLSIDASGNVGIGTTTPYAPLEVGSYGTSTMVTAPSALFANNVNAISGIEMRNSNNGVNSDFRFAIQNNDNSNYLAFSQPANGNSGTLLGVSRGSGSFVFNSGTTARTLAMGTVTNSPFVLGTKDTERVRIDALGNVGIGTATPAAVLDVYATGAYSALILPRDSTANRPTSMVNGMIRYNSSTNAMEGFVNGSWANFAIGAGVGTVQSIATSTGLLGGTITSSGTLSVDVGSSAGKIVQENSAAQIAQQFGTYNSPTYSFAGNLNTGMWSPGTGSLALSTAGSTVLTILPSGLVGIGAQTPGSALTVGITDSSNGQQIFNRYSTSKRTPFLQLQNYDGSGFGGYPRLILMTARGSSSAPIATLSGDVLGHIEFNGAGDTAGASLLSSYIDAFATENFASGTSAGSAMRIFTTPNGTSTPLERVRFDHSGLVGIGTTVPRGILELNATGTTSVMIIPRDTTANRPPVGVNGMMRYNSNTNAFEFFQNNAWVNYLASGSASAGFVNGGNSYGATATLGLNDYNQLDIETGGTARMTILPTGFVGIGTTTPNAPLNVIASTGQVLLGNSNGAGMFMGGFGTTQGAVSAGASYDGTTWTARGNTIASGVHQNAGTISLFTDSGLTSGSSFTPTSRLYIGNNGKVGIGTTSPVARLEVTGDLTQGLSASKGGFLAVTSGVLTDSFTAASGTAFAQVANSIAQPTFAASNTSVLTSNAYSLYLGGAPVAGTNETLSRASAIYVAPGALTNTSFGYGLQVYAPSGATNNIAASFMNGNVGIGSLNPNVGLDIVATGSNSGLLIPRDTTANRPTGINGMMRYNTNTASFEFFQNNGWVNYLSTATPGYVNGGNSFGANATFGLNDSYRLDLMTSGSARMSIDNAGNIGVGTVTPTAAMHVYGGNVMTDGTSALGFIIKRNGTQMGAFSSANNRVTIQTSNSAGIEMMNNVGGIIAHFDNNGTFGIGTTNPQAALDVVSTGTSSAILIPRDATASRPTGVNGMMRYNTNTNAFEFFQAGTWTNYLASGSTSSGFQNGGNTFGANASLGLNDAYRLDIKTAGTTRMSFDAAGNIGIGTSPASFPLDVNGTVQATRILLGNGSAGGPSIAWGSDSNTGMFRGGANTIAFATGGGERMRVDGSNIGIGTATTNAILDVFGTTASSSAILIPRATTAVRPTGINGMLRYNTNLAAFEFFQSGAWVSYLSSGSASSGYINGGNSYGGNATIGLNDSYRLDLLTAGSARLSIDSSGNVGVGTNAPVAPLQVSTAPAYLPASGKFTVNTSSTDTTAAAVLESGSSGGGTAALPAVVIRARAATFVGETLRLSNLTTTGGYLLNAVSGEAADGSGATSRFNVTSSGNVGIGITAPVHPLSLNSATTPANSQMRVTANGSGAFSVTNYSPDNVATGYDSYFAGGSWIASNSSALLLQKNSGLLYFQGNTGLTVGGVYSPTTRMALNLGNGNLGLGNSNPQVALDVNGTAGFSGLIVPRDTTANRPTSVNGMMRYNTNTNAFEFFQNNAWVNYLASGSSSSGYVNGGNSYGANATIGINDSYRFDVQTAGTTRMSFDNTGYIGIGTTVPETKLHIVNPTSVMDTPTDISKYGLRLQAVGPNGSTSSGISFGELGNAGASLIAYDGGSGAAQGFRFYTQNTSAVQELSMVITENGNVGIGTSAPNIFGTNSSFKTLTVMSPGSSASGVGRLELASQQADAAGAGVGNLEFMFMSNSTSAKRRLGAIAMVTEGNTAADRGGAMQFYTKADSASVITEKMRIDSLGNVGIGTTTPTVALDVNATGTTSAMVIPRATTAVRPTGVNGMMRYNTNTNAFEFFQNNAWVNYLSSGSSSSGYVNGGNSYGANASIGLNDAYRLDLKTSGTTAMSISSSGNVGIGTTSSSNRLVIGDDSQGAFSTPANSVSIGNASGNSAIGLGQSATNRLAAGWIYNATPANAYGFLGTTGLNPLILQQAGGNVGIGTTTTPLVNLHVYGTGTQMARFETTGVASYIGFKTASTTTVPYLGSGGDDLRLNTSGTTALTVLANGNVGIGTTSPVVPLNVTGNNANPIVRITRDQAGAVLGNAALQIHNANTTANNYSSLAFTSTDTGGTQRAGPLVSGIFSARTATTVTGDLSLATVAAGTTAEVMRLTSDGNVGIGTTAPRAALDVQNGSIIGAPAVSNATTTIDFVGGNMQYTSLACQAFALWNLKDGGSYTFAVKNTTTALCSFTAFAGSGTTALTVHMPPDHSSTTSGKHTIYSFLVMGTDLYISWVPGL